MTKLLDLFHQGMDTLDIAEHMGGVSKGWTESRAYNALAKEKETELNRKAALPKIRYAGYERNSVPWGGR